MSTTNSRDNPSGYEQLPTSELLPIVLSGTLAQERLNKLTNPNFDELALIFDGLQAVAALQNRWLPNLENDPDVELSRQSLALIMQEALSESELLDGAEVFCDSLELPIAEPKVVDAEQILGHNPNETLKEFPTPFVKQFKRKSRHKLKVEPVNDIPTIRAAQSGDKAAFDKIITSNMGFVFTIANRYRDTAFKLQQHFDVEDLVQEGVFGLMKAIEKYDCNQKETKLITYSAWLIRQHIQRYIQNNNSTIRVPVRVMDKLRARHYVNEEYFQTQAELPSKADVAEALSINTGKLEELEKVAALREMSSIDENFDCKSNLPLADAYTEDSYAPLDIAQFPSASEELVYNRALKTVINDVLESSNFTDRDKRTITLRFGLDGSSPRTLEEVGKVIGLTRERTRQIEAKLLWRLRLPRYSSRLIDFIEND